MNTPADPPELRVRLMFALGQLFDEPVISSETGKVAVPTPDSLRLLEPYLVVFRDILLRTSGTEKRVSVFAEFGSLVAALTWEWPQVAVIGVTDADGNLSEACCYPSMEQACREFDVERLRMISSNNRSERP
jgi:hypothetical protein